VERRKIYIKKDIVGEKSKKTTSSIDAFFLIF